VLKRFFMYTLACIETNAFKCYTAFTQDQDLSQRAWKLKLGDALIEEKIQPAGKRRASMNQPSKKSRTSKGSSVKSTDSVTQAQPRNIPLAKPGSGGPLSPMGTKPNPQVSPRNPKQAKRQACNIYGTPTRSVCKRNTCECATCPSGADYRSCFARHVAWHLELKGWQSGML
jgi:hypothetical protein